jgi:hypothetical protein
MYTHGHGRLHHRDIENSYMSFDRQLHHRDIENSYMSFDRRSPSKSPRVCQYDAFYR